MTEERAVGTLDTNEPGLAGSGAMGWALDQGTHRKAAVARAGGCSDVGSGLGTGRQRHREGLGRSTVAGVGAVVAQGSGGGGSAGSWEWTSAEL